MGEAALVENRLAHSEAAPVVHIDGFHKTYGKRVAVNAVQFDIRRGEIFGLIGPDGAGKSSLMKAVAGVQSFDAGLLEVFGVRIDSERAAESVKQRIGFMPQGLGLNLYPELSVDENIDFFARLRLVPRAALRERKDHLLAMTRLEKFRARPMKKLSGGMKQKLGLVCSLIHEPELLILDEPTTGVDPVSRRDFWAILTELLQSRGITALIATAYMDEAARFHRVAMMYRGEVFLQGEPDAIRASVAGSLATLRAEPAVPALARLKMAFPQMEAMGAQFRVFVDGADPAAAAEKVSAALGDIVALDLHTVPADLEDVFIATLRQKNWLDETVEKAFDGDSKPIVSAEKIAIEARELVCVFGDFRAVDNVSFSVPQGEIFGLLGANGAGKTTVIKMLTGLLPPSAGSGRVAGADMRSAPRAIKERIGYMSQAFSLYHDLTVTENIRLYAAVYGLDATQTRARLQWVIEMAGLNRHESDLAGSLPMGLRQRLALGCALVHRPQILFLDEPTSGVDPVGRRRFWDILFRLSREQGVTILVTTHAMSEAEHCDHLALMYAGRIVADASPAQMKQSVREEAGELLELIVDQPLPVLNVLAQSGFADASLYGRSIHLLARDPDAARRKISALCKTHGFALTSAQVQPLTMEDVFVYRVVALEKQESNRA